MPHKLSAILISGRPQSAKARPGLLDFGDQKVYERTMAAYAEFAQIVLVLSGSADGFPASGGRVQIVTVPENASVSEQMKAGIAAVDGSSKGFAIGLIDQPLLAAEHVDELAAAFEKGSAKVLVPMVHRQIGQPAFFHKNLASEFEKLGPEETAWTILRAHGDRVDVRDQHHTSFLRQIEDIEDYHAMLALAGLPIPEPTETEVAGAGHAAE